MIRVYTQHRKMTISCEVTATKIEHTLWLQLFLKDLYIQMKTKNAYINMK